MSSTNNSITRALDNRLQLLDIADCFSFASNDYTAIDGKGLISVTGQKTSSGDQTAKLKSIEDYSIFVTEEGEELTSYDDWEKIKRSIRANDVRCLSIIIFNPPTKAHMLYKEFYINVPSGFNGIIGNKMYIHTTYLDNGKKNMAAHNWNEYERLRVVYEGFEKLSKEQQLLCDEKVIKEARNYKNTILGGFRDVAEGVIFNYKIGEFDNNLPFVIGGDAGFTHPCTLTKVAIDKKQKKLYVDELYYQRGANTSQVYQTTHKEIGTSLIVMDSAAPLFISDLQKLGLKIIPAIKPKIVDSIIRMQDYEIIVTSRSENIIEEFDNYAWVKGSKEIPIDNYNHSIDGIRYALQFLTQQSSSIY
jgi:phage terminase large subunit